MKLLCLKHDGKFVSKGLKNMQPKINFYEGESIRTKENQIEFVFWMNLLKRLLQDSQVKAHIMGIMISAC